MLRASDEQRAGLLLQDMALCRLWHEAGQHGQLVEGFDQIPRILSRWRSEVQPRQDATQGRRHELLLRELIGVLLDDGADALEDEEAGLLHAARAIALEGGGDCYTRLLELTQPHADALEARSHRPPPGLPLLSERYTVLIGEELRRLPSKATRFLAGIEIHANGPVRKAATNTRVIGDIPDNCTLVVEGEHACSIDGYVLGRVLARRDCEVRGNIAGVVVVVEGNIRARGIINNAFVVTKLGAIACENAQGPKLMFAGRSIDVRANAMLGTYITRTFKAAKEVRGAMVQVSDRAESEYFRSLGNSDTTIVLRRELSCEDYGEMTGGDLRKLLSSAYRLRRLLHNYEHLAVQARREAEHSAQAMLMFLFGGGESKRALDELVAARKRMDVLERVRCNVLSLLDGVQEGLAVSMLGDEEADSDLPMLDVDDEASAEELRAENEKLARLRQSMLGGRMTRRQTEELLEQARAKLAELRAETERLAGIAAAKEREIQGSAQYQKLFAASKEATKLQVLQRVLPALRKQPEDSPGGKRLRTPFTVRGLRTIERRLLQARQLEEHVDSYRRDFRAVTERLGKEFQIQVLENPDDENRSTYVNGRFEEGIRIYLDVLPEEPAKVSPDAVIITPEDDGGIRMYLRAKDGTRFHTDV
ncbi:MAG: hypothetical protein GC168_15355 [Candidatus Hydrogenedens sp.]|nr:hypothetical protein [Candidatus Hydrogenedens sp.]